MATLVWFPASGTPTISPTYDPSWGVTTEATRRPLGGVPTNTNTSTGGTVTEISAVPIVALHTQYTSIALPADMTISGTFTSVQLSRNSNQVDAPAYQRVVVRVVSSTGVARGTLFTATSPVRDYYANFNAVKLTGTMTDVNALAGDRVVIERGWHFNNSTAATTTASYVQGDPFDSVEVPESYSTASAAGIRAWASFSQDDIWGPVPRRVAAASTETMGRRSIGVTQPVRIGGASVETAGRTAVVPVRVGGVSVEIMRGRAGQSLRRRIRTMAGTEPLAKIPVVGWRAIRPVPRPEELPKPPLPLHVGNSGGSVTSRTNTAFSGVLPTDLIVVSYVAGRAAPRNITSIDSLPGVTWTKVYTTGNVDGGGERAAVYFGKGFTGDTIQSNFGLTLDGADTACATLVSAWRYMTGTLIYAGYSANTTFGVKLTQRRVAVGNGYLGVSGVFQEINPPTLAWTNNAGTSDYFMTADPLEKYATSDFAVGNNVASGQLVMVFE